MSDAADLEHPISNISSETAKEPSPAMPFGVGNGSVVRHPQALENPVAEFDMAGLMGDLIDEAAAVVVENSDSNNAETKADSVPTELTTQSTEPSSIDQSSTTDQFVRADAGPSREAVGLPGRNVPLAGKRVSDAQLSNSEKLREQFRLQKSEGVSNRAQVLLQYVQGTKSDVKAEVNDINRDIDNEYCISMSGDNIVSMTALKTTKKDLSENEFIMNVVTGAVRGLDEKAEKFARNIHKIRDFLPHEIRLPLRLKYIGFNKALFKEFTQAVSDKIKEMKKEEVKRAVAYEPRPNEAIALTFDIKNNNKQDILEKLTVIATKWDCTTSELLLLTLEKMLRLEEESAYHKKNEKQKIEFLLELLLTKLKSNEEKQETLKTIYKSENAKRERRIEESRSSDIS